MDSENATTVSFKFLFLPTLTHGMYQDPAKDYAYLVFQHVIVILSVSINVTLMLLILKSKRKDFGNYRYLLLGFATVDSYYSIVHFVAMPIPESWGNAFYMGAHGYLTERWVVSWFASAHSHCFPVLVFHFIYRLLAVRGSHRIQIFGEKWFFFVLIFFIAFIGGTWYVVLGVLFSADDFTVEYMRPILSSRTVGIPLDISRYSTAVFWTCGLFCGPRWYPILGVTLMAITMISCYGFMIYAALCIVSGMRQRSGLSVKVQRMQKQLFRTLIYQTLLPLCTLYAPPLISVGNPFMGVSLPEIANLSPLLCGVHPLIDGIVIIMTISEFRRTLYVWIRRPFRRSAKNEIITIAVVSSDSRRSHAL